MIILPSLFTTVDVTPRRPPPLSPPRARSPSPRRPHPPPPLPLAAAALRSVPSTCSLRAAGRPQRALFPAFLCRIARGETSDEIAAMSGWRYDMFGRRAQALLNGKLAVSFEGGQVRLFDV